MSKATNDALRAGWVEKVKEFLKEAGEDVLVVGSNELCIPTVDSEGNDQYVCFTIKVPTGSRDGDAYDGYAMAEDYAMKCAKKAEDAKIAAEKKARKIARDQKMREERAAAKAAHQAKEEA